MAIALRQSTNVAGKRKREEEEEEESVKKAIALSLNEDSVPQSPTYPQEDDIPDDFWSTAYDEMESQPIIPLHNLYVAAPAPAPVSVSVSVSVQVPTSVLSPFDQFMVRNHPESLTARSLNHNDERINPRETYAFASDSDSELNDDDYLTDSE